MLSEDPIRMGYSAGLLRVTLQIPCEIYKAVRVQTTSVALVSAGLLISSHYKSA
jgi:hypothetical protein